ncbi:hypothetical protein [Fodinicola feengrottensis]|nr:hypothetical protein [Fodinicola feengrottensis]
MTGSDSPIAQFGWLVTTFTERVPGAAHAASWCRRSGRSAAA